jgi:hypothetical protein
MYRSRPVAGHDAHESCTWHEMHSGPVELPALRVQVRHLTLAHTDQLFDFHMHKQVCVQVEEAEAEWRRGRGAETPFGAEWRR